MRCAQSYQQAGNGISRRNIEDSKIAKGLQRISVLQYPKNPKVGTNWRAKLGTFWDFATFQSQNIKKIEGRPIEVIKILSKKVSQRGKN